jgi:hypothetical protein
MPFAAVLAVAVAIGRPRTDTLRTMSGIGDERTRANSRRGLAFAATTMAGVVPAWWLVTVARGEPNHTLSGVAAVFGVAWIVGVVASTHRG